MKIQDIKIKYSKKKKKKKKKTENYFFKMVMNKA